MLVLSVITGLLSGLAAVLLKHTVHFVQNNLVGLAGRIDGSNLLYFAYPALGMLLTVLFVRYVVKDNISHGVTRVLYAISRKDSRLPRHHVYTSIVASSMTIGFGGSVGAEAPIVLTGSAIGSNIGKMLRLNYKNITLLLACGAAGAIGGIFKAPLAGVIFTLEVLMIDITLSSIVPLLVSAVSATLVSYFLLGSDVEFANATQPYAMCNLPYYLLLGVLCSMVGLYFTRSTLFIESRFKKIRGRWSKLLVGGSILGVVVFIFPALYGEGYGVLTDLLNGDSEAVFQSSIFPDSIESSTWFIFVYLLLLLVFKVVAMSVTNSGGGVGGTFGPTLFLGGICGFFLAKLVNTLNQAATLPEANFTLVGMGGLMAAVMHSPLTAIFLIAEITGGYALLLPLMLTSVTAYAIICYFEPHSIYTKRLAQTGDLRTQNKDKAVLTLLRTDKLVEQDFNPVMAGATLGELVKMVAKSRRNVFPVIDSEKRLVGIVLLDDMRKDMFNPELYDTTTVESYMTSPPDVVVENESMEAVLEKFEKSGAWNLPVVSSENAYVGFVSKSKIFSAYRNLLVRFSS
ncbi:MAG: chloride channel protein [Prevotellaceae bacterium]|jgi:CIC family chloride channel protein|nr:chloride channel protein [Prevotellaceae bacterium]